MLTRISQFIKKFRFMILITLLLFAGAGGVLFILSGVYDIAAVTPHALVTRKVLKFTQVNSIKRHARNLKPPDLNKAHLIKRGFKLFRKNCVTCHGSPGESRSRIGIGLNPNPPPLYTATKHWKPKEIAWTITNGLKMAGMPAFILGESPDDIWAITAFVVRMNKLSPEDYRKMMSWEKGETPESEISWLHSTDEGWNRLKQKGDIHLGKKQIIKNACTTCHEIPGTGYRKAQVGPSLIAWKKRHFISGQILNNPVNLVDWIQKPQKYEPKTAMPDLNITNQEAWNMAAYLFSLD